MHEIFSLKTILTTLIGTSIASSLVALPVRANEDNLVNKTINLLGNNIDFFSIII